VIFEKATVFTMKTGGQILVSGAGAVTGNRTVAVSERREVIEGEGIWIP
jgi:hypothetical protein